MCSIGRLDGSPARATLLAVFVLAGPLALGLTAAAASELTIYRCQAEDGSVALQDQPCPADTEQRTRQTRVGPDSRPGPAAQAQSDESPSAPAVEIERPRAPPPALWECLDLENRSRYSDRDDPRGRWVPAWVIGADPRAPMRMFRDVGRPKPTPPRTGPGAPAAGAGVQPMVYVEDWCRQLDARTACAVYREQAREAERVRGNRVGGERDAAAAEAARLNQLLEAHCG